MKETATAADEKMYLQDDPSEKCRLQEICGKGYPGKNSHGEIVCFTGGCKFDTRARGPAPVCDDTCVYKRFAANMENAAAHDAEVAARSREDMLDELVKFTKGNSETIEADDGTLEDAVFLGDLLAKIESLRSTVTPGEQEQRDSINFTLAPIPKEQEWKRELPPSIPEGSEERR